MTTPTTRFALVKPLISDLVNQTTQIANNYDIIDNYLGLLFASTYRPGSTLSVGTANFTPATAIDIDATNLKLDFTPPPSGKVLIEVMATVQVGSGSAFHLILREGSSNVANSDVRLGGSPTYFNNVLYKVVFTGLSGAKTWKLGMYADTAAGCTVVLDTTDVVTMTVTPLL